jgi:hypothetical protein
MLSARSTEQLREAETTLRATGVEVAAYAADDGSPDGAARNGCWDAVCQRRQPPKAVAAGQRLQSRVPAANPSIQQRPDLTFYMANAKRDRPVG